jgi:hypothetical protein
MIDMSLIEAVNHPYSGFITLALVVAFALWASRIIYRMRVLSKYLTERGEWFAERLIETQGQIVDVKGYLGEISRTLTQIKDNTRK